jgi:surface polysaccharide O-acyltransferase-like enzyme
MLLSRRELSSREAWWLTFAGIVLQAVEAFLLTKYLHKPAADYQLLIGTVPFAVGMFGIAQRIRSNRGVAWLGRAGERYSLGIYVFHPYVLYVLGRIATRLGQEHSLAFGVAIVPMAFVFTWLSLALVDRANPWFLDALRGDAHALRASPAPDAERVG